MAEKPARARTIDVEALLPTSLLARWLHDAAADQSATTLRRYQSALLHFCSWYEQAEARPLTLADLHPITLVGYRSTLLETTATSTVNTHLCALRAWCRWLHAQGYLTSNPALRLKLVGRQDPTTARALQPAQVHALLRQAQHTRYPARNTAIVQMLVQTGLRISECAALRWEDIAFGHKQGQVRIRAGKGNKARTVPLNASARQALADYAAPLVGAEPTLKAVAAVWSRLRDGRPTAALWTSERGSPLSMREMSLSCSTWCATVLHEVSSRLRRQRTVCATRLPRATWPRIRTTWSASRACSATVRWRQRGSMSNPPR